MSKGRLLLSTSLSNGLRRFHLSAQIKLPSFLAVSFDTLSKRVQNNFWQVLDEVLADEDSDYGPELEALTATFR